MTIIRQTGVRLALVVAALLALTIGAAGAAAAPGSLRALDLSSPSLGGLVTVSQAGGGSFRADPGRALVRITPAGGSASQILAWCVNPDAVIAENVDYPVDLQSPSDTAALAGPGYQQAGWLIAASDRLIADSPTPGLEAAAIQVTVWQLTGSVADTPAVTGSAALNTRVAQLRALSAGRTLVSQIGLSAPAAPVAVGTPVAVTVTGTPGAVVDLAVASGAGSLSAAQVVARRRARRRSPSRHRSRARRRRRHRAGRRPAPRRAPRRSRPSAGHGVCHAPPPERVGHGHRRGGPGGTARHASGGRARHPGPRRDPRSHQDRPRHRADPAARSTTGSR